MTLGEMAKVYNMNMSEFKSYAIGKGYSVGEIENTEDRKGRSCAKGKGLNMRDVSLYTKYFENDRILILHTWNYTDLSKIRNQLKFSGFVLKSNEDIEGAEQIEKYRNYKFEITLITYSEDEGYQIEFLEY